MAVQVKSFSCLLDLDTFTPGNSSMTILQNDFSITPILNFASPFGTGIARIDFTGLVVEPFNCVFNFGFGFTLITKSGLYDTTGVIIPNLVTSGSSVYTYINLPFFNPANADDDGFVACRTFSPYYFNFKELSIV
jgi:hypothetical protein